MYRRQRPKSLLLLLGFALCLGSATASYAAVVGVLTFSDRFERVRIDNLPESDADIAFLEINLGTPGVNSGASTFRFFTDDHDLFEAIDENSSELFPYRTRALRTYSGFGAGVSNVEVLTIARISELEPLRIVQGGMVDMRGATATLGFTNGETFTRRLPDLDLGPEPEPIPVFDGPGYCACTSSGTATPPPTYTLHAPIVFSAAVTTVPLPASAWLLLSSLMSCGFIRRQSRMESTSPNAPLDSGPDETGLLA